MVLIDAVPHTNLDYNKLIVQGVKTAKASLSTKLSCLLSSTTWDALYGVMILEYIFEIEVIRRWSVKFGLNNCFR